MKVLLLSDIPPSLEFPSGLILDQTCEALQPCSIHLVAITHPNLSVSVSPRCLSMPYVRLDRPMEQIPFHLKPSLLNKLSYRFLTHLNKGRIHRLVNTVSDIALKASPDVICGVLAGRTQIEVVPRIAENLGIRLVTMVFDPPDWELRARYADSKSRNEIMTQFAKALKLSSCCASGSPQMAKSFESKYSAIAEGWLPSLPATLALPPNGVFRTCDELAIGICGNIYANDVWNALLAALHGVNWRIDNRNVRIHVVSRYSVPNNPGIPHVVTHGWHDQRSTIRLLSSCDLLYCPYWVDAAMYEVSRLSFPSKLTTYLASGRPVFFHGPKCSSVWEFLHSMNQCCMCSDSMDRDCLVTLLTDFASNDELRTRLAIAGSSLFRAKLTSEVFRRSIRTAFGILDIQ